jgi:putative ABC transport system permease protein
MTRRIRMGLLALCVATVSATTIALAATGERSGSEKAAFLVVSGLPGTDPGELEALPGLSSASGPYPTVATGVVNGDRAADVTLEGRAVRASAVGAPSLSSGSWARPGTLVLDARVAQALRARVGASVIVSTSTGPAQLRLGGITAATPGARGGRGYVTPQTLAHIASNRRTYAWTLYLRLADGGSLERYARWISERSPAYSTTVDVVRRPAIQ